MIDVDLLPDGVVLADADGTVFRVNAAASRMLQRSAEELIGLHLSDALPLDDLAGNCWFDCMRPYTGLSTRTRLSESSWHTQSGVEILVTATLHRDAPRQPVREVVVCLRTAKARAHRDRARSDLVATVAHELRSPLTGVKGFTATLLNNWDRFSDEQRQLMLETVDSDADRLSRLITDLLDAARIDSGRLTLRPQPVDLAEETRRILENVAAGSGLTLEVTADEDLPKVWVDPDRFAQVVTNLVENAQRHGMGVREIVVRRPSRFPDGVAFEIFDFGPGIPEEIRARMFTRFWRSGDRGGTGLGLYIVKGVVDAHGGEIEVCDGDKGGACVGVWFPENVPEVLRDGPRG
ncbi:PAS domain-containing protein [Mumia sp. zg.B53]|uniref:sensor histidine kinase n=1 Tax=unclassified Mumia TaxID=2621872 RepID=UPI001C6DF9A1|nr:MULTISPECIES: ATP-binding protein [unclassified Mumia]MBW9206000.1 PAS domain-containing protein [Mumia sp. zg.B17]MBW9211718.1 PAS domain-containing protein [Mumia sp. zg.B21]MBW9216878.1 PAS domain-containing protein [Mumia sp. zg.B53]MDD9347414.1 ATP-binding protein [Mumia sp.]